MKTIDDVIAFYNHHIGFFSAPILQRDQFEESLFSNNNFLRESLVDTTKEFNMICEHASTFDDNFKDRYNLAVESLAYKDQRLLKKLLETRSIVVAFVVKFQMQLNRSAYLWYFDQMKTKKLYRDTLIIKAWDKYHKNKGQNGIDLNAFRQEVNTQLQNDVWIAPVLSYLLTPDQNFNGNIDDRLVELMMNLWHLDQMKKESNKNLFIESALYAFFKQEDFSEIDQDSFRQKMIRQIHDNLWLESLYASLNKPHEEFKRACDDYFNIRLKNTLYLDLMHKEINRNLFIESALNYYLKHRRVSINLDSFRKEIVKKTQDNSWLIPLQASLHKSTEEFKRDIFNHLVIAMENIEKSLTVASNVLHLDQLKITSNKNSLIEEALNFYFKDKSHNSINMTVFRYEMNKQMQDNSWLLPLYALVHKSNKELNEDLNLCLIKMMENIEKTIPVIKRQHQSPSVVAISRFRPNKKPKRDASDIMTYISDLNIRSPSDILNIIKRVKGTPSIQSILDSLMSRVGTMEDKHPADLYQQFIYDVVDACKKDQYVDLINSAFQKFKEDMSHDTKAKYDADFQIISAQIEAKLSNINVNISKMHISPNSR